MRLAGNNQRLCAIGLTLTGLFALVAWGRALAFEFVYDDHWTILQNASLERPLGALLRDMLHGNAVASLPDATRPAMVVSMWVDWHLFGPNPVGFHLHSLVLYVVACLAATVALWGISRRVVVAVVGGLFFALTPVHAEVVAAVNYREDLLAALGVLVPLAAVARPRPGRASTQEAVALAGVWFIGLLGKESAVGLVLVLAVWLLVSRPGAAWMARHERIWFGLASVGILWLGWRWALRIGGEPLPQAPDATLVERVLQTARFELIAARDSLAPFFWSPEHTRPTPESGSPLWLIALLALVAFTVVLARWRATRPYAVGLGIILVSALPMSPLVGPKNFWADRYALMPSFGGALIWGCAAAHLTRRLGRRLRGPALGVAVVVVAGEGQSALATWQSDASVWTTATRRTPDAPRAWQGLAWVRRRSGDLDGAEAAIERALALRPGYRPALVTRVYNLIARGRMRAARKQFGAILAAGGEPTPGMARAGRCLRLSPGAAKTCLDEDP